MKIGPHKPSANDDRQADQASELRSLIHGLNQTEPGTASAAHVPEAPGFHAQPVASAPVHRSLPAQTIAVTSGKGGVGKSVLTLNLAISLAQAGHRVCVWDADFGLGNLDFLCGLNGYWNLTHVLSGARQLQEIILSGPAGIDIIPGASGLIELADLTSSRKEILWQELSQLERLYDYILIDCGTGIHHGTRQFAMHADTVLLVSTLETTSLADTYAALKVYHAAQVRDLRIVFNRTESRQAQQAIHNLRKTAKQFLQAEIQALGCVPEEAVVAQSVAMRVPFIMKNVDSASAVSIAYMARRLSQNRLPIPTSEDIPFIKRLQAAPLSATF